MDRNATCSIAMAMVLSVAWLTPLAAAGGAAEVKLVDGDGAEGDGFGSGVAVGGWGGPGVALDGDVIVVGSLGDTVDGVIAQGSATVFRLHGASWEEEQELTSIGGAPFDGFGSSVAIHGDVVVVGAFNAQVDGEPFMGAATVFRFGGMKWDQEQVLTSSRPVPGEQFGATVAVAEDLIVVGVPSDDIAPFGDVQGSVRVYSRTGGGWSQTQTLTAGGAEAGDNFGSALAIDGELLVVGARGDDVAGIENAGSATVFRLVGTRWVEEQTLVSTGVADNAFSGSDVSVSGDVIVVGAWNDEVAGKLGQGSATVFRWDGASWNEEQRLTDARGAAGDQFGWSVAVSGDLLVVGAPKDDVEDSTDEGSTTVFRWNGATWDEAQELVPGNGSAKDGFGRSVTVQRGRTVVSSPANDVDGEPRGAVFVYDLAPSAWADQGCALAGALGLPSLVGCGDLLPGGVDALTLTGAAADAPSVLFVALQASAIPFKGGTLKPYPFAAPPIVLVTDETGSLVLTFRPPTLVLGTELWVQLAIADAGAVQGVALSNALVGMVP